MCTCVCVYTCVHVCACTCARAHACLRACVLYGSRQLTPSYTIGLKSQDTLKWVQINVAAFCRQNTWMIWNISLNNNWFVFSNTYLLIRTLKSHRHLCFPAYKRVLTSSHFAYFIAWRRITPEPWSFSVFLFCCFWVFLCFFSLTNIDVYGSIYNPISSKLILFMCWAPLN